MANEIAFSDQGTMLYYKNGSDFEELVGIKSAPASGGEPPQIDVTELNSLKNQYIPDRVDNPNQNFTYNRTAEKYEKVLGICDGTEHEFLIKFSDGTGTYIKGIPTTWKNEVTKGSALEATLCIVPSEITDKTAVEVTALLPA